VAFDPSRRILDTELIDTAPPEIAAAVTRDLVRTNRWLGGRFILPQAVRRFAAPSERFSVLDVGAASGDMARCLTRRFPNALVCSLDRRREFLRDAPPPRVAADAFHPPFPEASFDFVTCSLFLHHFDDASIVRLLAGFRRIARRAVIVVDLPRIAFAYYFFPVTRRLFGWHDATVHDACLSVQAGFRRAELAARAREAGACRVEIRAHWPWARFSMILPGVL
jgi:SAM-dependent methyltransferase